MNPWDEYRVKAAVSVGNRKNRKIKYLNFFYRFPKTPLEIRSLLPISLAVERQVGST
jgi:hypothetical protein